MTEVITTLAVRVVKEKDTSKNTDKIRIKAGDEILFIRSEEIVFIEKQDRHTLIHTKDSIYITAETLADFENMLNKNFLRVHKSFIVNMEKIKKIKEISSRSYEIEFYDYNKTAQMSRYKFEEYKDIFTPLKGGVFFIAMVIRTPYMVIHASTYGYLRSKYGYSRKREGKVKGDVEYRNSKK